MREWLSGGAPPCQGGGRGFESRLALLFFTGDESSPVFCVVRPAAHVSNRYKSEIRPVVGRI